MTAVEPAPAGSAERPAEARRGADHPWPARGRASSLNESANERAASLSVRPSDARLAHNLYRPANKAPNGDGRHVTIERPRAHSDCCNTVIIKSAGRDEPRRAGTSRDEPRRLPTGLARSLMTVFTAPVHGPRYTRRIQTERCGAGPLICRQMS